MAIRGKELMKQVLNKVGENNMTPAMKESLEKSIPDSKVLPAATSNSLIALVKMVVTSSFSLSLYARYCLYIFTGSLGKLGVHVFGVWKISWLLFTGE